MSKSETYYKLRKAFIESLLEKTTTLTESTSVVKDFTGEDRRLFDLIQDNFNNILNTTTTNVYSFEEEETKVKDFGSVCVNAYAFFDDSNIFLILKMEYEKFTKKITDRITRRSTEIPYSPIFRVGMLWIKLHKGSKNLFEDLVTALNNQTKNDSFTIKSTFQKVSEDKGVTVIDNYNLLRQIAPEANENIGFITSDGGWFHLVTFNQGKTGPNGYPVSPLAKWMGDS